MPRTIKIKSELRPDLEYIIIEEADFDPAIHVQWSEAQSETPPADPKQEGEGKIPSTEEQPDENESSFTEEQPGNKATPELKQPRKRSKPEVSTEET